MKGWNGVNRGENIERGVSGLLDLVANIRDEELASYDAMLREKILGVAQQHDALFMYVMMHHATVTYYYFIGEDMHFVDRASSNELSSRHLLCLVVEAIQKYREIFGLTLPMNGLRDYNAYAAKIEKDGRDSKFQSDSSRFPGKFNRFEGKTDHQGERNPRGHPGKKLRRVLNIDSRDTSGTNTATHFTSTPALSVTPKPEDAFYGPPPSSTTKQESQEPKSMAVMCHQLPDGTYMPVTKVRLLIDTGNSVETLIPSSLMPFMFNIQKCHEEVFSFNSKEQAAIARYRGELMFLAELDDGSWDYMKIKGLIMDECPDDEIILARNALSNTIELRKGNVRVLQCLLREAARPIALDSDCTTEIIPVNVLSQDLKERDIKIKKASRYQRILRVTTTDSGEKATETGIEAITSLMKDLGISTMGINPQLESALERLILRIHRFVGHAPATIISKLAHYYNVIVSPSEIQGVVESCSTCIHSRKNAKPVKAVTKTHDLTIAYTDITQPTTKDGIHGAKYIACFVDDADEVVYTAVMSKKSQYIHHLVDYLKRNPHIDIIRSDNAPEIIQEKNKDILARNNVILETSAPGSSRSIGKVERTHQTLKKLIEKAMVDMGLHDNPELWPWLVPYATNALNNRFNERIQDIPTHSRNKRLGLG